jgi:hypothetical protein
MIDFKKNENTSILPENSSREMPKKEDVVYFLEQLCKNNVDEYMIFKKNSFKNQNLELIKDFFNKFENYIKDENSNNDNKEVISTVFNNIKNNIKILEYLEMIPKENKNRAFIMSFISSRLFS